MNTDRHDGVGLPLWPQPDVCDAYHGGADTSKAAAKSVSASVRVMQRAKVLAALEEYGPMGATCDQVEVALGGSHQSISARISELKRDGAIVDSGRRRMTRTGRTARVLVLARFCDGG